MAETPFKKALRIPPQSIDAEMAFLGSIMLRPEVLYDVMDAVSRESFYSEKHRVVFETMLELFAKGDPIDLLTLSSKLKEKNQLEKIGGSSYLSELVNSVPSSSNAEYYAKIIQKKRLMRQLIAASESISSLGYDESRDLEELLDSAEKAIFEVTNFSSLQKFTDVRTILGDAWERIDKLHNEKDGLRGVPTGFAGLDNKLSGLQKSDLVILAARPSVGKTSLALDIARNAAMRHDVPVGIFSLEMSSQQLVDRMLASESKVDAWKLRTGKLTAEEDFGRISSALAELSKAPIFIDDQPGNNILKMRSVARRLKSEKGLGLIIVDYLQLMSPTNNKNNDKIGRAHV